ncbi:MAG: DUF4351 domain-containing protein [Crocosphaera sp.]
MNKETFYKGLSVEQLESLCEYLLDFETQDDLVKWLSKQGLINEPKLCVCVKKSNLNISVFLVVFQTRSSLS